MTSMLRTRSLAFLFALAAGAACDSVSESEQIPGEYRATTLTGTENGTTTDFLNQGVSLSIKLNDDGTTTGRFFVPNEVDASMAGRWTVRGDTVRFEQSADTFVRDVPFLVRDGRLQGDATFDKTRVRVTLSK
jgi:hypothetical protein